MVNNFNLNIIKANMVYFMDDYEVLEKIENTVESLLHNKDINLN